MHQREPDDQERGPEDEQHDQRERPEDAKERLADGASQASGDSGPGRPGELEKEACQAEVAVDAAWEYHRLEGVPEDDCDEDRA